MKIEEFGLSVRAVNCLKKKKIFEIEDLMKLSEVELIRIKNLGKKTLKEILELKSKISEYNFLGDLTKRDIQYRNEIGKIDELNLSTEIIDSLKDNGITKAEDLMECSGEKLFEMNSFNSEMLDKILEIREQLLKNKSISIDSLKLKNAIEEILFADYDNNSYNIRNTELGEHILLKIEVEEQFIENIKNRIINQIRDKYSNSLYKDSKELKKFILNIISNENKLISNYEINENLPKHLKETKIIEEILEKLVIEKKIEKIEDKYRIFLPTLEEYIDSLQEKHRTILKKRLSGITLEEIAIDLGVTRERIRQISNILYHKIPRVREDDYKEIFEKYCWYQELFISIFNVSEITYNFLKKKI